MNATDLNLWVLAKVFEKAGRTLEIPNKLAATDRPHMKRCIAAGLVLAVGTVLRLTDKGAAELEARRAREERNRPRYCEKCGLGLAPAQTTASCPRCRDTRSSDDETTFTMLLKLSADSPAELRACDVDRVMDAADQRGVVAGFTAWLVGQVPSGGRVAAAIAEWKPEASRPQD